MYQILLKSDSTAFVPFTVVLSDVHDHIEDLFENKKFANVVTTLGGGESIGTQRRIDVTLPKYDHFFQLLKYKCKPTLIPVPLVSSYFIVSILFFCLDVSSFTKHANDLKLFVIYLCILMLNINMQKRGYNQE